MNNLFWTGRNLTPKQFGVFVLILFLLKEFQIFCYSTTKILSLSGRTDMLRLTTVCLYLLKIFKKRNTPCHTGACRSGQGSIKTSPSTGSWQWDKLQKTDENYSYKPPQFLYFLCMCFGGGTGYDMINDSFSLMRKVVRTSPVNSSHKLFLAPHRKRWLLHVMDRQLNGTAVCFFFKFFVGSCIIFTHPNHFNPFLLQSRIVIPQITSLYVQ